ncbi:uncharacterized protein LOC135370470 [Ornithodoros turicata]|uniref:uncharacterized protein LOC135370470 n=1 Tax=Ornithodoros turicata TaxID=34597 RepID=UPI003138959C
MSIIDCLKDTRGEDDMANDQWPSASSSGETSDDESSDEEAPATNINKKSACHGIEEKLELKEKLYDNAKLTRGESMLLIMAHALRHSSSKQATESLLRLVELHLPINTTMPISKYHFFNVFCKSADSVTQYLYCPSCKCSLGTASDVNVVTCPTCATDHSSTELLNSGSYFLILSIETQLRMLLEQYGIVSRDLRKPTWDVGDITQSSAYANLPLADHDVTVSWSTDGVPVFEASNYSIWPLQLQVNELEFKIRTKSLLLAGLWFGPSKPEMNTFLEPFVKQMNELSIKPFAWKTPSGEVVSSRVFTGPCIVDTVARCALASMSQFNGQYGCLWCTHKGEVTSTGRGHSRVYPIADKLPKKRTDASFRKNAAEAAAGRSTEMTCGIKGATILFQLAFFFFPMNFVVDHMHAVCLGFVRSTASLWFGHKGNAYPYHIGNMIPEVDRRLNGMKVIWEITRLPRSLTEWKYWKASEWRNWLLFYSPVVLKGLLPKRYFLNWLKFVHIMHILHGKTVPMDKLHTVQQELISFLKEYQDLYGKSAMKYNTHLLLHLIDSVMEWGPLWCLSCFCFEGMNAQLLRLINGTRYVHMQIVDKYLIHQSLQPLVASFCVNSLDITHAKGFVTDLMRGYPLRKISNKILGALLFGKGKTSGGNVHYSKVSIENFMFCTAKQDKSRRNNSFVFAEGRFGQILDIIVCCREAGHCKCERPVAFKIQVLQSNRIILNSLDALHQICGFVEVARTTDEICVNAFNAEKCVALNVNDRMYLCTVHAECMLECL